MTGLAIDVSDITTQARVVVVVSPAERGVDVRLLEQMLQRLCSRRAANDIDDAQPGLRHELRRRRRKRRGACAGQLLGEGVACAAGACDEGVIGRGLPRQPAEDRRQQLRGGRWDGPTDWHGAPLLCAVPLLLPPVILHPLQVVAVRHDEGHRVHRLRLRLRLRAFARSVGAGLLHPLHTLRALDLAAQLRTGRVQLRVHHQVGEHW